MSTEYYSEPEIPFEQLLGSRSVEVRDSLIEKYVTPHRTLHKDENKVYAFIWDGVTRYEAFGDAKFSVIAKALAEEFCVKFFDEYGVPVNVDQ